VSRSFPRSETQIPARSPEKVVLVPSNGLRHIGPVHVHGAGIAVVLRIDRCLRALRLRQGPICRSQQIRLVPPAQPSRIPRSASYASSISARATVIPHKRLVKARVA
jgi:hypothetical protein